MSAAKQKSAPCPNCHAQISRRSVQCPRCGVKLQRRTQYADIKITPDIKTCPECFSVVHTKAKRCSKCGCKVKKAGCLTSVVRGVLLAFAILFLLSAFLGGAVSPLIGIALLILYGLTYIIDK